MNLSREAPDVLETERVGSKKISKLIARKNGNLLYFDAKIGCVKKKKKTFSFYENVRVVVFFFILRDKISRRNHWRPSRLQTFRENSRFTAADCIIIIIFILCYADNYVIFFFWRRRAWYYDTIAHSRSSVELGFSRSFREKVSSDFSNDLLWFFFPRYRGRPATPSDRLWVVRRQQPEKNVFLRKYLHRYRTLGRHCWTQIVARWYAGISWKHHVWRALQQTRCPIQVGIAVGGGQEGTLRRSYGTGNYCTIRRVNRLNRIRRGFRFFYNTLVIVLLRIICYLGIRRYIIIIVLPILFRRFDAVPVKTSTAAGDSQASSAAEITIEAPYPWQRLLGLYTFLVHGRETRISQWYFVRTARRTDLNEFIDDHWSYYYIIQIKLNYVYFYFRALKKIIR